MAIALVASAQTPAGASGGTSSAINTIGATLLVMVAAEATGGSQPLPTDSLGNTWIGLTAQGSGGGNCLSQIFYVANPTVGAAHTFAFSGSSIYGVAQVLAFSGIATASPFDVQNGFGTGSGLTIQPGTVTPSQANSLIIAGFAANTGPSTNAAINSGFSSPIQTPYTPGVNYGGGSSFLIQSGSSAAVDPTWSWGASYTQTASTIAVFKPTASTPGILTGTSTATSSATGTLTGRGALSGTSTGASATVGTLTGHGILSGTSAATSTTTAALTGSAVLSGASTAVSTSTGTLAGRGALFGASAAGSAATALLTGAGHLTGTSAAGSSATGTVTTAGSSALAGASVATSAASGTLTGFGPISGVSAAGSSATGVLVGLAPVYPPFTPDPRRTISGSIQHRFATGQIINRTI